MPNLKAYHDLEGIRHRLPNHPLVSHQPTMHANVLELAPYYDSFWFDAFGVLNVGAQPIAGSIETIAQLRALGKQVLVVSNACARSKSALHQHFCRLGFDFSPQEIVSSRDAFLHNVPQDSPQPFGIIGLREHQEDLPPAKYCYQDDEGFWEESGSFWFMSSLAWDSERQKRFVAALEQLPRPVYVGNPDLIAPQGQNSSIEPGSYTLLLPDHLFRWITVFGKPYPAIFALAVQRAQALGHDYRPERTLMLGDTLHTDIIGANAFGIQSALLTEHGFFKGLDVHAAIANSGIVPHHLLPQL